MLNYRFANGKNRPTLTCDSCKQSIDDVELAGVVYRIPQVGATDGIGDAMLCHKGDCMDRLELQLGANYDGWEELYRYLSFITHNVKLSSEVIDQALQENRETGI